MRGIQQSCVCEVEEVPDIPPVWSFFNMLIMLRVKSWHCQSFNIISSTKIMLSHTSILTNIPKENVFLTKEKPSKCCGAVVALGGAIFILATKPGPGVVVFMTLVGLTILFFDQAWGEMEGVIDVYLKFILNMCAILLFGY